MKKTSLFFIAVLGTIILMTACGGSETPAFRHVETIDPDRGIFNYNTIIEGADAHSGKKFARTDSVMRFGLGYSYLIPDSLKGKVLSVNIDAWVRSGDLANNCDIAVSCTANDSIALWSGCNAREFVKNPNEWSHVTRSVVLQPGVTSLNNTNINVMMHNVDGKSYFDMDDLKIEYLEIKETN